MRFAFAFLFCALLAAQATFWEFKTRPLVPELGIVPAVPGARQVKALSFGDDQLYFRINAFRIQNAGESFGRVIALKNYDYKALAQWWNILEILDPVSDYVASIVAYYYSLSQEPERDVPYVVDYLEKHGDREPTKKWWWWYQAMYNAKHRVNDNARALEIANKLARLPKDLDIPIWVRQLPAFLHEEQGEYKESCHIILNILDTYKQLSPQEINYIHYYIRERIAAMARNKEAMQREVGMDPRCYALAEQDNKMNGGSSR